MTQHTSRLCKGYLTNKESDGVLHKMTWPQPNWDGLGWVGPQSEGRAANKCSAYVGTPSRPLENHSRWSWLRECQEWAKLSSRQRVATLKNLKYILSLFWLLHDSMCYFIVLMSSLLFYNVEHSKKIKKNSWMRRCVQTFDWYCITRRRTSHLSLIYYIYSKVHNSL